ncbi:MAG: hypothetical protein R3B90_00400 [Planctomycetaceae bacterium]
MASSRAALVAEVLWELKRADKVATYSAIATRAGFSAGTGGRTMRTCLKTVRRDWPHLQWWRAISDDGAVKAGGEQERELKELGVPVGTKKDDQAKVDLDNEFMMSWAEPSEAPV